MAEKPGSNSTLQFRATLTGAWLGVGAAPRTLEFPGHPSVFTHQNQRDDQGTLGTPLESAPQATRPLAPMLIRTSSVEGLARELQRGTTNGLPVMRSSVTSASSANASKRSSEVITSLG